MGYFPNGTAAEAFENYNCAHCKHGPVDEDSDGCPIWMAHLAFNYDQFDNKQVADILGMLIPRDKVGQNSECAMFLAINEDRCRKTPDMFGD